MSAVPSHAQSLRLRESCVLTVGAGQTGLTAGQTGDARQVVEGAGRTRELGRSDGLRQAVVTGRTRVVDQLADRGQSTVAVGACNSDAVLKRKVKAIRDVRRHFNWCLPWSAASTAKKNDVIYVIAYA